VTAFPLYFPLVHYLLDLLAMIERSIFKTVLSGYRGQRNPRAFSKSFGCGVTATFFFWCKASSWIFMQSFGCCVTAPFFFWRKASS
jgi:hypothetical protein